MTRTSDTPFATPGTLVLDTNIVLDWLVFANPQLDALAEAVRLRRLVLYTHAPARAELTRVLGYALLKLDARRQTTIFDEYLRNSRDAALPADFGLHNLLLPPGFPQCRDPDDQHFLALTLHARADALVTHDKALLKLRRRAARFGVTIVDVPQLQTMLPSLD